MTPVTALAAATAGLASCFVYEPRGSGPALTPWFPSAKIKRRWADLERIVRDLNEAEDEASLPLTRSPDCGFFALAYGWAAGEELAEDVSHVGAMGVAMMQNGLQLLRAEAEIPVARREIEVILAIEHVKPLVPLDRVGIEIGRIVDGIGIDPSAELPLHLLGKLSLSGHLDPHDRA